MKKYVGLCLVGVGLIAANGFSQAPAELPPPPPGSAGADMSPPPDPLNMNLNELMTRSDALLQKGDTNAAVSTLMMIHDLSLQQNASRFYSLLNKLFATGNLQEAERIYQDTLSQNDRLMRDYYNILHQHYASQNNAQAMLEWTTSLQTRSLPPDLRAQAFGWLFEASRELGPVSRVTDLVPVCITNFDVPTSRGLLVGVVNAYVSSGDYSSATSVLDTIERAARRQAELRAMVTGQRVNMLFSAARWPEAQARFQKEAKGLPDGELNDCFRHARECLGRANQTDLLEQLCTWILKEQKNKPNTWLAAAGAWLKIARDRKAVADIPVRLETLMKMGCPEKALVTFYYENWDMVIKTGKPADLVALLNFGERLFASLDDGQEKDMFRGCALDGYCILGDYERALQVIEKPLPRMDPAEQAIAVNKIKAHLALQKGNKQEAVERFRAFMDSVKKWTQPEFDPITGMMFTKEMCLGLNASRIGDILLSMNDAAGAQAAYQEADRYYAIAQKEVRPNSPESEYIKARMGHRGTTLPDKNTKE